MTISIRHAHFIATCLMVRITVTEGTYGPHTSLCSNDVPCQTVQANSLNFHCRVVGPSSGTGVLLLHGFPEWSKWYIPLLSDWVFTAKPWRAVACDLRGYSPGALPSNYSVYTPSRHRDDVLAIADAFNFSKFHLVGHDHGAALGWYVAHNHPDRVLSYSAFSVPHTSAWSTALYGANADVETQAMFNYANQWSMIDSATRSATSTDMFGMMGGSFQTAAWFQKALWWYTGTVGKTIAQPPVLNNSLITQYAANWVAQTRLMMPLPARPGVGASEPVGAVSVPVLFVCGSFDTACKCHGLGALYEQGGQYCTGSYRYLLVQCGHNFFNSGDCASTAEKNTVIAAVNKLIEDVESNRSPSTSPTVVTTTLTLTGSQQGTITTATAGCVLGVTKVRILLMAASWQMVRFTLA